MNDHWQPQLYNNKHAFVYGFGENLIQWLDPKEDERILDLGCGSGQLTAVIAERGAQTIGIDASAAMIAAARQQYPKLGFTVADATDFHFAKPFDAIFSNATLHWVLRYRQAIGRMYDALKPGGRLVLEMGGKGNIRHIEDALRFRLNEHGYGLESSMPLWFFPSLGKYTSELEDEGFSVSLAQYFDRPTQLADSDSGIRDWLRMFASSFFEKIPEEQQESIIEEVQEELRPQLFYDSNWYADYKRLRIIAYKPLSSL